MFAAKSSLKKVHWNVQTACNMPCGFCYLWRKPHPAYLSTAIAKSLIREASEYGVEWFVFGGGDPLLRDDFLDLLEYAHQLGLKIDLQTNAILLSEQNPKLILSLIHRMGLSLDGEEASVHDTIRNYTGHFQIILNTLSLCDSNHVPVTVRTVVCRQNLGRLSKLGRILNLHPCVQKWSLRQFAPLGRGGLLKERYSITDEQFSDEFQRIVKDNSTLLISFPIVSITTEEMTNCYCLISQEGEVYGHPSDGVYKSVGTYPQEPLANIVSRLSFDSGMRDIRELKSDPQLKTNV